MSAVLIIGELDRHGKLTAASAQLATAGQALAQALGQPLIGGLIGTHTNGTQDTHNRDNPNNATGEFQYGLNALYVVEQAALTYYNTEFYVQAAAALISASGASTVLVAQGAPAREWVPALAARLQAGLIIGCDSVKPEGDHLVVVKPVNGGSVLGTFAVTSALRVLMLNVSQFSGAKRSGSASAQHLNIQFEAEKNVTVLSEDYSTSAGGPRLKEASIVVSGGRGVGGQSNWHHITKTAEALAGAVGCSRPVAESGWLASSHQVGLSGTTVAPDLYLAVGISGAPQHLAGITAAKTVVAINTDEQADIFKRADYGIVDDFAAVLPGFIERVEQLRG